MKTIYDDYETFLRDSGIMESDEWSWVLTCDEEDREDNMKELIYIAWSIMGQRMDDIVQDYERDKEIQEIDNEISNLYKKSGIVVTGY